MCNFEWSRQFNQRSASAIVDVITLQEFYRLATGGKGSFEGLSVPAEPDVHVEVLKWFHTKYIAPQHSSRSALRMATR